MRKLQAFICSELERIDARGSFQSDTWDRAEGGGGITNTIKEGAIIEKGGVAFSAVHGPVSEQMKKQLDLEGETFLATGVSIVLHPRNVHIPIIHMNVRYFELDEGKTYWFGGGIDLTPHYIVDKQAVAFHKQLKSICDKYSPEFYSKFKPWADTYFYSPHRGESRGIGGVFYDHLSFENTGLKKEKLFELALDLGNNFPSIYEKQVDFGKTKKMSEVEKKWRDLRRSRYVEFNLLHDRGTKFGLFSGGRTESILMSMPPQAAWEYDYSPISHSEEEKTLQKLKIFQEWV